MPLAVHDERQFVPAVACYAERLASAPSGNQGQEGCGGCGDGSSNAGGREPLAAARMS
jgi:hypothetical protein